MHQQRKVIGLVVAAAVLLFAPELRALSADDVMKRVQEQSRLHATQEYGVYMQIFDKNNRRRERFFTTRKKIKGIRSMSLVRFYKPSDIKNTGLLSQGSDDRPGFDQWVYLPAFKSIRKLSSDDKNKSFMGSDFSNSDVAGRSLQDDRHSMLSEDAGSYYIRAVPVSSGEQYSKIEYKINRKIFVPEQINFYDRRGRLLKRLKNTRVKKVKGMYIVTESSMVNEQSQGRTDLSVQEIKLGLQLNDNLFSTKGLKL